MESSIQIIWTFLKLSVFLARSLAVIGKTADLCLYHSAGLSHIGYCLFASATVSMLTFVGIICGKIITTLFKCIL